MRPVRSFVGGLLLASVTAGTMLGSSPAGAQGYPPQHRCLDALDEGSRSGLAGLIAAAVLDPWCPIGAAVDAGVLGYSIAACRSFPPTLSACPHLTQGDWHQDLLMYTDRILRRLDGLPVPTAGEGWVFTGDGHGTTSPVGLDMLPPGTYHAEWSTEGCTFGMFGIDGQGSGSKDFSWDTNTVAGGVWSCYPDGTWTLTITPR